LLKFSGIISNGGEAKIFLLNNKILINGEAENRRGRKLFGGEIVRINDQLELLVVKK
jgi:ribosome-associated protein YbcJ (S4-like RNA binding protein)